MFLKTIDTHVPIRKLCAKAQPCYWLKTIGDAYHARANESRAWGVYKTKSETM